MFFGQRPTLNVQGRIDVHERRAPTDESVRLLRELEAEALKRVIGSLHLASCRIDANVTAIRDDLTRTVRLIARANVNGRDVTATHDVEPEVLDDAQSGVEALAKLRDEFAGELAAAILAPAWPKLLGNLSHALG